MRASLLGIRVLVAGVIAYPEFSILFNHTGQDGNSIFPGYLFKTPADGARNLLGGFFDVRLRAVSGNI